METKDETDEALLELVQHNIFKRLLPVIVFLTVLSAAGIVGNSLAFVYYAFKSKQSSTVQLIAQLAIADFIVCILNFLNIIEMAVNVRNTQSFLCKLKHTIAFWAIACSILILWVIAIDRYRKICTPFGKQLTMPAVKYAVAGICVFGFFLSVRNVVNFDTVEVTVHVDESNKSVVGHYCTTQDDERYAISIKLFTVIDFLLVLMIWMTIVIAYSRIIYTLHKLKRRKQRKAEHPQLKGLDRSNQACKAHSTTHSLSKTVRFGESTSDTGVVCTELSQSGIRSTGESEASLEASAENEDEIRERSHYSGSTSYTEHSSGSYSFTTETSIDESESIAPSSDKTNIPSEPPYTENLEQADERAATPEAHSVHQCRDTNTENNQKKQNTAKSNVERNLTFKMLVVSLVFILCFTPYFVIKILIRLVLKYGEEYEIDPVTQFALRLPYMNSVFNPVVYCVFNPQFRQYIRNVSWGSVLRCYNKTKNLIRS